MIVNCIQAQVCWELRKFDQVSYGLTSNQFQLDTLQCSLLLSLVSELTYMLQASQCYDRMLTQLRLVTTGDLPRAAQARCHAMRQLCELEHEISMRSNEVQPAALEMNKRVDENGSPVAPRPIWTVPLSLDEAIRIANEMKLEDALKVYG